MPLTVREVFKLPLRALQGFLSFIMRMLGIDLPVPSYTQICRRAKALQKRLHKLCKLSGRRPHDIVFDSTKLKVFGEDEWKVRQHGISKRRTWRKLHIAMDPHSGQVIAMDLTGNDKAHATVAEQMLDDLPTSVRHVLGDKAYDRFRFRRKVYERGATNGTPPSNDAKIHWNETHPSTLERNRAILDIKYLGGDELARKLWKKLTVYHKRSLVETTMYRIKQILGDTLRSRCMDRQCVEAYIK